ncbi:hypothetical protein [Chitinophaga solisilvae]|uniref:hypothetical protein n=1 Tax=Chitinophaga solisilvae TaxID=1233460 RepID=UPI00136DF655|nr:hypothetical protein [Chitinophaga solisilvae]
MKKQILVIGLNSISISAVYQLCLQADLTPIVLNTNESITTTVDQKVIYESLLSKISSIGGIVISYQQIIRIQYLNTQENIRSVLIMDHSGVASEINADYFLILSTANQPEFSLSDKESSSHTGSKNFWMVDYSLAEKEINHSDNVIKKIALEIPQDPKKTDMHIISSEPGILLKSLKQYILSSSQNRWLLITGIIGSIIQLIIFKSFYPYPNFIHGDSFSYLETAMWNLSVNTYPIGYSVFLRLFNIFWHYDSALIAFQYFFLQGNIQCLLFTLFYFYNPHSITKILLWGFMVLNPVLLFLGNLVSSDALFLSLSLLWFNTLLWIIHKPGIRLVIIHSIIIFLVFTIRYNALYYPLIAGFAFLISREQIRIKITGLALGIVFIGCFIHYTSLKYKDLTGEYQFSPFTGWQLANNALYAYRYIDSSDVKPVPKRFTNLDKMVRTYFDTSRDLSTHPSEMMMASTVYMWDPSSPLLIYKSSVQKKDTAKKNLKSWASMGPLYGAYGEYLIREYPLTFAKYYLWPNAIKYYAPPVEFLKEYNGGTDTIPPIAKAWFQYKTTKVISRVKNPTNDILDYYQILVGIFNVLFLLSVSGFLLLQGHRQTPRLLLGLVLISGLWLTNFLFSVFASPVALRFQLFPIIVLESFTFLFMGYIITSAFGTNTQLIKSKADISFS